jgi:hypothetical protein
LAECCVAGGVGVEVELEGDDWETTSPQATGSGSVGPAATRMAVLFGEGPGGFVVSGAEQALRALGESTQVRLIGRVGGASLRISAGGEGLELTLAELAAAHEALRALFP